tara:strand:+ start:510 stop:794 length:285 start_codon:yes stop_codon:yes gene_type:complete
MQKVMNDQGNHASRRARQETSSKGSQDSEGKKRQAAHLNMTIFFGEGSPDQPTNRRTQQIQHVSKTDTRPRPEKETQGNKEIRKQAIKRNKATP